MFSASKSGQYQGYQISRSVRLRSSASAYFNRTPASAGSRTTWTYSKWMKFGAISADEYFFSCTDAATYNTSLVYNAAGALRFVWTPGAADLITTQVFRDPSAWYHVVLALDTTQATAANRVKLYINGVQVTAFSTASYPAQNATLDINRAAVHNIGRYQPGSQYFDGYLTEINFIDGQALTPASFGVTNAYGVWSPIKYNGTYGTNGFYLNFSDNSGATATTIGKDSSGNGNNWTPNNISVTAGATYDSMLDVPTQWPDGGNGRGNYPVINRLDADTSSLGTSITFGNLRASGTTYAASVYSCTFQVPQSGKWYYETVYSALTAVALVGIRSYSTGSTDIQYASNGNKYVAGSATAYGSSWTTNDVIGIAVDRDAGTVTFYKNNVSQGAINIPTNSARFDMAFNSLAPYGNASFDVNFGQRPFAYTPPSGFRALNTQNLPTPTIANGANYFAATTYTGTGASRSVDNTVNNVSFQPDFVWVKGRSGATDHALYDAVRGVQKQWETNTTTAETTETTGLTAFNSNGFTVGALAQMNTNTATYVAWQWKEGATQGFDIVTYTGNSTASRSVNHNLGVTPSMIFVKNRTTAQNNIVAHTSLALGNGLLFDTTGASTAGGTRLRLGNSTAFTVGDAADYTITNQTGNDYVAYCFAAIAGFSAFGSYTGNGSTDGPFVFCGFRPRFVLVKVTSAVDNWWIQDTSRSPENVSDDRLFPNLSNAEAANSVYNIDFLSNGFKVRGTGTATNDNGATYIFAAFAENPFKYSLAR